MTIIYQEFRGQAMSFPEPTWWHAREQAAMHCQCCGRAILANNGKIAHHGYERPGTGWQTSSCMGARYLPFEVSRDRLGDMIAALKRHSEFLKLFRGQVEREEVTVAYDYTTRDQNRFGERINRSVDVSRDIWDGFAEAYRRELYAGIYSFDDLKERELSSIDGKIRMTDQTIKECQARYDAWKQTHKFINKEWQEI